MIGSVAVSAAELEKTLRDHNAKKLAMTIDKTTTVGEMAEILAIAHAVNPDVRLVPPIEAPMPAPAR